MLEAGSLKPDLVRSMLAGDVWIGKKSVARRILEHTNYIRCVVVSVSARPMPRSSVGHFRKAVLPQYVDA